MAETRYLYPHRKRMEVQSAVFAAGFGVHLWATSFHGEPLAWAGIENGNALWFGQFVTVAALVHAMGIKINGRWQWSPVLRLTGMICHALAFFYLAAIGIGQSAAFTYGFISFWLAFGAYSAGVDTLRAWKGQTQWKPI